MEKELNSAELAIRCMADWLAARTERLGDGTGIAELDDAFADRWTQGRRELVGTATGEAAAYWFGALPVRRAR
jgi:hypothetical protein